MKKTALAVLLSSALFAGSAMAHEAGSTILRLGAVTVDANSSSQTKTAVDVNLRVRNNTQLGLTLTHMFTDNFAVELLGATPFEHKINATVPALGKANENLGNVVSVKQLPPSLYAQYYFFDKDSAVRPYIGAGVNYTRFFDGESLNPAVSNLRVKKHSVGPVANVGVDVKLADNLYFNAAAWYTRIRTTAKFDTTGVGVPGKLSHEVKIKVNPMVYFAGLSFRF
ncbi:hypothetical protein A4G19_09055 [Pasteurellaceae bacterium Macca]|nr:hypothetical protein [Pasteurellaceae bacterium Macca]